jgi:hypothetical protein
MPTRLPEPIGPPVVRAAPLPAACRVDGELAVMCALAWSAGLIHIAAAVAHLDEYALFAVFFQVLAIGQLGWGALLYRSASRGLLVAGAIVSVMVVALWVASRTSGLPIGPEPWAPEPVGLIDALASADELLLALLVVCRLWPGAAGTLRSGVAKVATGGALCLVLVSSLALVSGPHVH